MDEYALKRGIKRIISVFCFLVIISFFTFYWLNAILGSDFSPYPFTAGSALFCFMIGSFWFLGWRVEDEYHEGGLHLGIICAFTASVVVLLHFITFMYFGIVTSIVNLPGNTDFIWGTGFLFLMMAAIAVYFLYELLAE